MREKAKLVKKVKHLIRKAGLPRRLHHFGPKKFEFWHHAIALLIKQECKLSYRRTERLLTGLGFHVPTYSALAKMLKRLPVKIWQFLLSATTNNKVVVAAVDGTGMSRTLPSPYYIKRIDKEYPTECPLKLSILSDTKTKKVLALRARAKPRADILDAKYLLRKTKAKIQTLTADKAYDAEHLHEYAFYHGIKTQIPTKKNIHRGFFRKKNSKNFRQRTYNRRSIVESVIFMLKRKYGASVSSATFKAQQAELYCRAIMHNLSFCFRGLFQLLRFKRRRL